MPRSPLVLAFDAALFQVFLYAYVVMETLKLGSALYQSFIAAAWLWLIVTVPLTLVSAIFVVCLAALARVIGNGWVRVVALTLTGGVAVYDMLSRGSLEDAPQLVTFAMYGAAVRLPGQSLGPLPVLVSVVGIGGWGALVALIRPELF